MSFKWSAVKKQTPDFWGFGLTLGPVPQLAGLGNLTSWPCTVIVSTGEEGAGEETAHWDRQLVLQRWPASTIVRRTCLTFLLFRQRGRCPPWLCLDHHQLQQEDQHGPQWRVHWVGQGILYRCQGYFLIDLFLVFSHCPWHGSWMAAVPLPKVPSLFRFLCRS